MKKMKFSILAMALVFLFVTGCEDDPTTYPPKENRLEVTIEFAGNPIDFVAKDDVQVIENPVNVFTFTANNEVNGIVLETWTLKFEIDPDSLDQEQVLLISDNYYNSIRLDTPPNDDNIGNYLIEKGDLNDNITTIIITKYIPGEEIQGEFYGNIHALSTSSNDSLKFGFFHTNNFKQPKK